MSSPIASLKKGKRQPIGNGERGVPFRTTPYAVDESKLLDEVTSQMASSRLGNNRSSPAGALPKLIDPTSPGGNRPVQGSPSDHELMSIMMARLTQLQQQLQLQTKDIVDKDKQIKILEEKVRLLQKNKGLSDGGSSGRTVELERRCLLLQQQVYEMENFLSDYGMVWVGDQVDPDSDVYVPEESETQQPPAEAFWKPDAAVAAPGFVPKFDEILRNILDLNVLAGDGLAKIQRTVLGARLKIPDRIPLTLYANGIVMFSGPFRSYSDPTTVQCIHDLEEGYFPEELQGRFPDGVPIKVTDQRHTYFNDKRSPTTFSGSGQVLGGETKPSRLVPSNVNHRQGTLGVTDETSQIPGPKMSMEQFLSKLPQSVMKQGKVIDIRSSVGDVLHGAEGSSSVTVVETETTNELKARLEQEETQRPPSSRNITTLRIKSENGNHTYILKMKFSETIGDLRRYLDTQRPRNSCDYQIVSSFPSQVYADPEATLKACGLIPSAALHLRKPPK